MDRLLIFIFGLSLGFAIGTILWTILLAEDEHNEETNVADLYDFSQNNTKDFFDKLKNGEPIKAEPLGGKKKHENK